VTLAADVISFVLAWATPALAGGLLLRQWSLRRQWRQIETILGELIEGRRPTAFIVHGGPQACRVAFGLEKLADERAKMERQISQEGFNLQAILSSMVEGVMVVDTQRQIRLANASLMRLFDLSAPPLDRSVLQALRSAAIDDVVRTALREGETESREVSIDLVGRHLAISAAPVRDAAGAVFGVAATFHDLTRLKQLEQVRREFVANVSHELRTPLSIFQGYLETLQETPDVPRDELQRSLQVLMRHSQRLNALVEDLLTLARLESRQGSVDLAPVDLQAFLFAMEQDWTLKFSTNRVRLKFDAAEGVPPLQGDVFRLEQVMYNLLDNARKYTPPGGEVTVSARLCEDDCADARKQIEIEAGRPRDNRWVEIRVSDSGSGIPGSDLAHIFERFYRADKARSRALGGTGLGLTIVKHIVHLHGGTVRAESVYGKGTTIVVRLPLEPPVEPAENKEQIAFE